jgi:hypothetical protein
MYSRITSELAAEVAGATSPNPVVVSDVKLK